MELFDERPYDLVGRHVRLEALEANRHCQQLHEVLSGEPSLKRKSFDPDQVWGFQPEGPFKSSKDMEQSFVFKRAVRSSGFAIVSSLTDSLVGAVHLTKDCPEHLSIQIDPPFLPPEKVGSQEELEACFLLMDRLFAYGYRRIQISVDSQDSQGRKLAAHLGFTFEGIACREMVLKDANRDSSVFGLLNSDWKRGARAALFKKLHGETALRADLANEKQESELDNQKRVLDEQKQEELKKVK